MIAVLDNIRSNHNVGSIFRTADAFGIKTIYLCGITPQPVDRFGRPNKELLKVALKAERYVPWEYAPKTYVLLDKLKYEGYTVYALEQSKKSRPISAVRLPKARQAKAALVVGNEVKGLSGALLKRADHIIEIPMVGKKESLNVAVAFGIAAYALVAQ
ncbi:MAG: RNA methyltransferase [Patescibacteria group bacterium]